MMRWTATADRLARANHASRTDKPVRFQGAIWPLVLLLALFWVTAVHPTQAQGGTSAIRLVNGSPDGGELALRSGAAGALIAAVPFRGISPYIALPPGAHTLELSFGAGAPLQLQVTLQPGQHYSVAVAGRAARRAAYLFLDNPMPPEEGLKVRLYHLSSDAPALDLRRSSGATLVPDMAFPEASPYVTLSEGDQLMLFPTLVAAPMIGNSVAINGVRTTWSIFVLNDLSAITAVGNLDQPVSDAITPVVLPNTSEVPTQTGALLLVSALLISIGFIYHFWLDRVQ